MHIHCAAVANKIPAPDTLKDEFARKHLAAMLGKEEQKFIFFWLDLQRLIIEDDFAAGEVNDKVVKS